MQFDPAIILHFEYDYGYRIMSNPISHSYLSQSYDNLINKILKILSNFHPVLINDSLNHQSIRASRMRSLLIKSDRFHVDLLTTSIHTPPYPEHPVHDYMNMN